MYREVTMIELREVLRLRAAGLPKKRIAAQLGLDPKTVRRYLDVAATASVPLTADGISDEHVRAVLLALHPIGGRPRCDGWARCGEPRAAIARWLGDGLRLTKIRKLLLRQGVAIAYPTLHRFAVLELQFGKTATTIPVVDGEPGHEVQVDTGWVGHLTLPQGKRRRFRAWIFTAVLPAPTTPYDIPLWAEPKVARDQLAVIGKAFYSIPHAYVGQRLTARADAQIVRSYARGLLIKTHARQAPGGRSIDPHDYPVERSVYAMRNVAALQRQADAAGAVIGRYAAALLDSPLPWTRMRRVYALLGLVRRYGAARVTETCRVALAADLLDVKRLERMLQVAGTAPPPAPPARVIPLARYLRPATQYALPLRAATAAAEGEEPQ